VAIFGDNDGGCGLKAYTLTSKAKMPDQLPIADILNQNNNLGIVEFAKILDRVERTRVVIGTND
jgi:hypothetical protein